MILYLDTSALIKRYIDEVGTEEVAEAIDAAIAVGTCVVSRVEAAAALAKAVRMDVLNYAEALAALRAFRADWPQFVQIPVTDTLIARADSLAWELGLRGYDAVQLSSALTWRDNLDEDLVFATFDRQLWRAANQQALTAFPIDFLSNQ